MGLKFASLECNEIVHYDTCDLSSTFLLFRSLVSYKIL